MPSDYERFNCISKTEFPHNIFPNDNEKFVRRIERLKNILETSDEKIFFLRKGHATHNHIENNMDVIKSDLADAEDLDNILTIK